MQQLQNNKHLFMKSLIVLNVLTIAANAFLIPLWAVFVKHIGGDVRTAGNAVFIFSIIIGFFTLIAAKIENRTKNEETIMIVTAFFLCIAYLGYFIITRAWELYVIQIILGLLYAFQCPAIYALYHRYMPKPLATYHWGIWNGFYNIAMGIAALVSGITFYYYGLNSVFVLLFAISAISFLLTVIIMHKIKSHESNKESSLDL